MTSENLPTLFHPFESGDLAAPGVQARLLFINAPPGLRFPSGFPARPALVQPFRPDFLALERAGHAAAPQASGRDYDLSLVLCTRHRGENELNLAGAIERTKPGGLIVMAGGKTDGAASLRKRLQPALPLGGHLSKNHGTVFWLVRSPEAEGLAAALKADNAPALIDGRFHAAPGMFSHDRVDAGSRLLAEHLPADFSGIAADFGSGWGFLSAVLAERSPGLKRIDLYEAHHPSLEAARENISRLLPGSSAQFHWIDLQQEPVARQYDLIVMNPPFHEGRAAEPGIGHGIIAKASLALKPRGKLLLVANRGLPYEAALTQGFASSGEIARDSRFKVLSATR